MAVKPARLFVSETGNVEHGMKTGRGGVMMRIHWFALVLAQARITMWNLAKVRKVYLYVIKILSHFQNVMFLFLKFLAVS